jgi:hypothetical protein
MSVRCRRIERKFFFAHPYPQRLAALVELDVAHELLRQHVHRPATQQPALHLPQA